MIMGIVTIISKAVITMIIIRICLGIAVIVAMKMTIAMSAIVVAMMLILLMGRGNHKKS